MTKAVSAARRRGFGTSWKTGLVVLLTAALVGCGNSAGAETGSVVRIIDGDTLVINIDSENETVRLLNVDTPETKHPDKPVECLGTEATDFLRDMLPPGTQVGLDYDEERTDQYGRTLAAVFTSDKTLVNAEIAEQGLGVAVLFEPNDKYYSPVRAAQDQAKKQEHGLYDSATGCSVPAEVDQTLQSLADAIAAPAGSTADSAAATAATLVAAITAAESLEEAFEAGKDTTRWLAATGAKTTGFTSKLGAKISAGKDRLQKVEAKADKLKKSEAKEAAEKKAEARQQAAAKAERERKAAEERAARKAAEQAAAAERDRLRNLQPAPAPQPPAAPAPAPAAPRPAPPKPAPKPAPEPAPTPKPAPEPANPYPGYTGPRCYDPGGVTWQPC
ncbi:thermonuclease family protein [Arthrobacter castelli]|uniref:thermonuclease family protein n=1 Tax=Arthrobacter castelli TaxID=271431 RepID=UPI000401D417|nr:thermonuclease family protein [Arthrobacter castelli]